MSSDSRMTVSKDIGFSVLEAMVAMALLAAAMLPLLSLQGQFSRSIDSIERADRRLDSRYVALNLIKTINPQTTDSGEFLHRDAKVTWKANPVRLPQIIYDDDGIATENEISLFDISVTIVFEGGAIDEFTVRRVGWQ